MLTPFGWGAVAGSWTVKPVADALVLLAVAGYLWRAYRVLPRYAVRWSAARTVAFLGAAAVLLLTLQSFIEVHGHVNFSIHMVQHLLLIMVVPVLIILGAPLSLLTSGEDTTARVTDAAVGSRATRLLAFPGIGFAIYAVVVVGTHLTPFLQEMVAHHPWLHAVEVVSYLVGGYLFFLPLVGHEPLRRQWSYPLRVFLLLLGMVVDTVVGVMLMMHSQTPFPAYGMFHPAWGAAQLLSDVRTGGAIMWVIGDALMFAVTVTVLRSWITDTARQNDTGTWLESARRSALAANTGDTRLADAEDVDDDEALAAYNRMLTLLHERDQQEQRR